MIGLTDRRRAAQSSSPATNYLMTATSNTEVFAVCLAQGWCSAEGMTYEDAANISDIDVVFKGNADIINFNELEFFNVGIIQASAFFNCINLEEIKLPNNLLKLNGSANFQGCASLKKIDIPSTVTNIGSNCFVGCTSVQYAIIRAAIPPTLGNASAFGARGTTYPIYVPDQSVATYKAANNWNNEIIVDRIKSISEFVEPT